MRIVFMGTSSFAADILRILHVWSAEQTDVVLAAVYCQPDRPAGRGHKLVAPPVKTLAEEYGIPVFQPLNFRDEEHRDALRALEPDVLAVASYGLILPQAVLDIPSCGPFNVHASLLPRYRGAAPIERALMNGDVQTGVTIMRMEAGLDTGPMLAQRALGIGLDDTAGDLHRELAELGGTLLCETLERFLSGKPPSSIPQDDTRSTYASKLLKNDGFVDWNQPVSAVHARLRGVTPRPGGRTVFRTEEREIPARIVPGRLGQDFFVPFAEFPLDEQPEPGTVLGMVRDALAVACADAAYLIPEICPADRKPMAASAFWNGYLRRSHCVCVLPS